jgi:starvation-inducible DNA-binding protein
MTMVEMEPKLRPAAQDCTVGGEAIRHLSGYRNGLPAHLPALHAKTNSAHCYVSGPHSRDYYLLQDEQGAHIFDLRLAAHIREAHGVCDEHAEPATASLLQIWIDDTEKHVWYVFGRAQSARNGLAPATGW